MRLISESRLMGKGTYAAEEMADKDEQDSVLAFVEALELVRFAICVDDGEVGDSFKICFRRRLVRDLDIAFEVACWALRF